MSEPEESAGAGDRKRVRENERKERRADEQLLDDYRELLANPAARRILARLIFDECHLNDTSFHASGQQFAANEGRRGVAVQLQAELMNASLEGWFQLHREHLVKAKV